MAKSGKNGAEGTTADETAAAPKAPTPPSGFRRRGAVADAPWYKQKDENIAFGKLLGRYIMKGVEPQRPYYQVELYKPCLVTVGKGEEAEEVTAEKGDVINVGETFKLECLRDVEIPEVLAGAEYDVWVHTEKKIKIGSGRTMWVIDVQTKRMKAPTGEVRPLPPENATAEGDGAGDAPF